jgi:hypothetical protein
MKPRRPDDPADVPEELARFELDRWVSEDAGPAPGWWQDDPVTGTYAEFKAKLRWQAARRAWVRGHANPAAALAALHPSWSEWRIAERLAVPRDQWRHPR